MWVGILLICMSETLTCAPYFNTNNQSNLFFLEESKCLLANDTAATEIAAADAGVYLMLSDCYNFGEAL